MLGEGKQLADFFSQLAVLLDYLLPGHSVELHLVLLQLEFVLGELLCLLLRLLLTLDQLLF